MGCELRVHKQQNLGVYFETFGLLSSARIGREVVGDEFEEDKFGSNAGVQVGWECGVKLGESGFRIEEGGIRFDFHVDGYASCWVG